MRPTSEGELAELIRGLDAPVQIRGGGTRGFGGSVPGEVLKTGGLSGISLYEPGALTLVARAGTPLAEIEAALAAEGQALAFEPMDHRPVLGTSGDPTIGGVVACNLSGPRRVSAGACRDFLLGVRFVTGTGEIVKNGGRVMKNVTGYDLVKLMAGAHGTLGVLTEVSLKVLPAAPARAVLLIHDQTIQQAVTTLSDALGTPFEVSGAAYAPKGIDGHPITMIRLEGTEASVIYRADALKSRLGLAEAEVETNPDRTRAGWAWVRDAELFKDTPGDLWRISVKPSDAPDIVALVEADRVLLDWGGGLIWAEVPPGTDLRDRLAGLKGHATLVRASDETKRALGVFHPEAAPLAKLAKGLCARFDPKGLLNRGLMG